jgi:hypothetical protein
MSQMGVIRYRLGVRPTSAFPLIATKLRTSLEVGFVPPRDIVTLNGLGQPPRRKPGIAGDYSRPRRPDLGKTFGVEPEQIEITVRA